MTMPAAAKLVNPVDVAEGSRSYGRSQAPNSEGVTNGYGGTEHRTT